MGAPSGTVALLFTDIVGSTELSSPPGHPVLAPNTALG
jgi:hypothetical protein